MGDQDEEIKDEEETAEFNPDEKNEFDGDEDIAEELPHADGDELIEEDPLRKTVIGLDEAEAEEGGDEDEPFDDVDEM